MKPLLRIILTLFTSLTLSMADPVTVPGSEVTFHPPDGFTALTKGEISLKFPPVNTPEHVVGNPRRTTTIVHEWGKLALKPEQLGDLLKALPGLLGKMFPGMVWKEKKLIDLAGQKWGYMEGTHDVFDGKAHDILLFTSHNGKFLKIQFGTMETEWAEQEKALRKCIESITLKKP